MLKRGCNLECKTGKKGEDEKETIEFIGPVKIVLVDQPKSSYRSKECNAAFVVLAQMAIAIVCFFVIFYTLSYDKKNYMKALHIFLCTVGLLLLLPLGVLTMNGLNGAAQPMTLSGRRFEHGVVQIFGLGYSIAGSAASYFAGYPQIITTHSVFGLAANGLASLSALVGIFAYIFCHLLSINVFQRNKYVFFYFHYILGILTMTTSSTCFFSGIMYDSFIEWFPAEEMIYCLLILNIFYTCVVIYNPFKLMSKK